MDDEVLPGMDKGHEEMAKEILSCRRRRNRFFWIQTYGKSLAYQSWCCLCGKNFIMTAKNRKSANKLSTSILNYFAAFTETKFNFRTLINYRGTNNELTLDLAIFQDFQDALLQRIKARDNTPLIVRNNEHILTLSGDAVLLEIDKAVAELL